MDGWTNGRMDGWSSQQSSLSTFELYRTQTDKHVGFGPFSSSSSSSKSVGIFVADYLPRARQWRPQLSFLSVCHPTTDGSSRTLCCAGLGLDERVARKCKKTSQTFACHKKEERDSSRTTKLFNNNISSSQSFCFPSRRCVVVERAVSPFVWLAFHLATLSFFFFIIIIILRRWLSIHLPVTLHNIIA